MSAPGREASVTQVEHISESHTEGTGDKGGLQGHLLGGANEAGRLNVFREGGVWGVSPLNLLACSMTCMVSIVMSQLYTVTIYGNNVEWIWNNNLWALIALKLE